MWGWFQRSFLEVLHAVYEGNSMLFLDWTAFNLASDNDLRYLHISDVVFFYTVFGERAGLAVGERKKAGERRVQACKAAGYSLI